MNPTTRPALLEEGSCRSPICALSGASSPNVVCFSLGGLKPTSQVALPGLLSKPIFSLYDRYSIGREVCCLSRDECLSRDREGWCVSLCGGGYISLSLEYGGVIEDNKFGLPPPDWVIYEWLMGFVTLEMKTVVVGTAKGGYRRIEIQSGARRYTNTNYRSGDDNGNDDSGINRQRGICNLWASAGSGATGGCIMPPIGLHAIQSSPRPQRVPCLAANREARTLGTPIKIMRSVFRMTVRNPLVKFNGWETWENDGTNSQFKKPWVAFHPLYDGHYYEEFDTRAELEAFCTVERLQQWERELI